MITCRYCGVVITYQPPEFPDQVAWWGDKTVAAGQALCGRGGNHGYYPSFLRHEPYLPMLGIPSAVSEWLRS